MNSTDKPTWPHGAICRLTPHMGARQWCKKVKGKLYYFGVLADPDGALRRYLAFAGQGVGRARQHLPPPSTVTMDLAVNAFLSRRMELVDAGERSAGQYVRYQNACRIALNYFGRECLVDSLTPQDFTELKKQLTGGPVHIGNQIMCIRAMFAWVDSQYRARPAFGDAFDRPGKRARRESKRERGLWTAEAIRAVLPHCSPALRCFTLLGINAAFGQGDCAALDRIHFDVESHWFPRPKNGNPRMCPLWPETVAALCAYDRPYSDPAQRHLFFVTEYGRQWVVERIHKNAAGIIQRATYCDSIGQELDKACDAAKIPRRPFYDLRHTFYSVADEVGDPTARDCIMGHTLPGMKEVYSHLLANRMSRLKKITDYVHDWLFTESTGHPKGTSLKAWREALHSALLRETPQSPTTPPATRRTSRPRRYKP